MWQEWDLPYYGSPPKYTKQKTTKHSIQQMMGMLPLPNLFKA